MVNDPDATQNSAADTKKKTPKEPAIKFRATTAGMKTLLSGEVHLVLSADKKYIPQIMALLNIEQSGDSIAFTAVRVKAPKIKIVEHAEKKPIDKKNKRRRRYPYKD
jgi:hypothetical protein